METVLGPAGRLTVSSRLFDNLLSGLTRDKAIGILDFIVRRRLNRGNEVLLRQ